jgi:N-acetylmuramoyl-L-alanine amidase
MRRFLFALFACAPLLAHAAAIGGVAVEQGAGGIERLRFATDSVVTPTKVFTLGNPDRVVIDLPALRATGITLPVGYRGALVRGIRFGQFDAATSRIVVDAVQPVKIVGTLAVPAQGGQGAHLLIDIQPFGQAAAATGPASPVVAEKEKPLVVIDAGHGGQDPGALGLHGTREKNVTLAFAKALKNGLLRTGRYRVALTREDDSFIMLPERVNIARKVKADIFISLHADSNPRPEAQGLSVYTLSETASDDEAAALAERENKSDIITGLDLNTADEDVASILIDLAQRETMNKSSLLAEKLVASLHPKINKLTNTHRFAGFRVLKAPDIPSVLIEMGFLSNAADERLLQSADYQSAFVTSVTAALDRYLKE